MMNLRLGTRNQVSTRVVALASFAVLLFATAACGGGTDDSAESTTTAAAGGEKQEITVYTGRKEELIGDLVKQFTEETGIKVNLRPGDSGELAAQIITEGDASPADAFFSQDAGALGALSKAGLLSELDAVSVDAVPAEYRAADGTWVGTSGRVRVIIYNPNTVSDPPKSVDDLLDPKYKGKIGFAPSNASFQSFVTALRVLRGEDEAKAWLEAFAAQDPVAYEGNSQVRDAVDSGEIDLGLVNHYYLLEKQEEVGADKVVAKNQFVLGGDPAGLVNVAGIGILKSAKNPAGAQEFVDFLLSETGQKYFAETTFEYPLTSEATADESLPALAELDPPKIDLSDLDSVGESQELLVETGLLQR